MTVWVSGKRQQSAFAKLRIVCRRIGYTNLFRCVSENQYVLHIEGKTVRHSGFGFRSVVSNYKQLRCQCGHAANTDSCKWQSQLHALSSPVHALSSLVYVHTVYPLPSTLLSVKSRQCSIMSKPFSLFHAVSSLVQAVSSHVHVVPIVVHTVFSLVYVHTVHPVLYTKCQVQSRQYSFMSSLSSRSHAVSS